MSKGKARWWEDEGRDLGYDNTRAWGGGVR